MKYLCVGLFLVAVFVCPGFLSAETLQPVPEFGTFVRKAQSGEPVVIAYLGGSITWGAPTFPLSGTNVFGNAYDYTDYDVNRDSWRGLTYEWLRSRYEQHPGQFRQVHAAIGGTPSLLGAYRLEQDILPEKPDLIFVEFAVNDSGVAQLTQNDPKAPRSIFRTCQSIVNRVRAANPNAAVFMPLSTRRELEGSKNCNWAVSLDLGHDQSLLAAEALSIPYVSIRDAYYGTEERRATGLYYDGDDSGGNYVHPAPFGHKVYAEAVEKSLMDLFETGTFSFTGTPSAVRPYPVTPTLVLPDTLVSVAPGWQVELMAGSEAPCLEGRRCLVSKEGAGALEYTFKGTGVGLWFDDQTKGCLDVFLDSESLGQYVNRVREKGRFRGRFSSLADRLDPSFPHTLRLVPKACPESEVPHIMLRAVTVDKGVL